MTTLSELRNYVWDQTQTVENELSTASVDAFLQEAFNRTIAMENQWPFFEKTWVLTQPAEEYKITLPGDTNPPAFTGLYDDNYQGREIELMAHNVARGLYAGLIPAGTFYNNYSVWANQIHLWPQQTFTEDRTWTLTGFRLASDWLAGGPDGSPDCDERLHRPLAHYAIALAYSQQEDEQLEASYMKRYEIDVQAARSAIMEPSQDRPLIFGPRYWRGVLPHSWSVGWV